MLKFNIQSIIINSGKTKGLFSTFHKFQIKCVVLTNITQIDNQRLGSSFNCNVLAWIQSAGTKIIRFNLFIKYQPPSHLQTNKCDDDNMIITSVLVQWVGLCFRYCGGTHGQDRQHLGPVRQQGQGAHWRLCQQEEAGLGEDLQQGKYQRRNWIVWRLRRTKFWKCSWWRFVFKFWIRNTTEVADDQAEETTFVLESPQLIRSPPCWPSKCPRTSLTQAPRFSCNHAPNSPPPVLLLLAKWGLWKYDDLSHSAAYQNMMIYHIVGPIKIT